MRYEIDTYMVRSKRANVIGGIFPSLLRLDTTHRPPCRIGAPSIESGITRAVRAVINHSIQKHILAGFESKNMLMARKRKSSVVDQAEAVPNQLTRRIFVMQSSIAVTTAYV